MFLPSSTYRIQTSSEFTLEQIREIVDYLEALGISTIYSAPFFQAGEGSTHGYDVINPHQIGEGIGDHATFTALATDLKKRNMSWLQDIVPNHMAFTPTNPWIHNILELGQHSPYYNFFDINWVTDQQNFFGKVMTPFLGSPLEEVLKQHQIKLVFNDNGFYFDYFGNLYPLKVQSYYKLLSHYSQQLEAQGADQHVIQEYTVLLTELEKWDKHEITENPVAIWHEQKARLQSLAGEHEVVRNTLTHIVEHTNRDWHALKHLLFEQNFQLTYWKDTESAINYRRFFTVNDLICLNMQEKEVFEVYHRYIKELVDAGWVQGLRIDHVDGLFDPTKYLEDLRKLAGEETYLIVEKILEAEEQILDIWPIQGSSGYEFLAQANQLYTDTSGEDAFTRLYKRVANTLPNYEDMVFQNKMFILLNRMQGELNNLFDLLKNLDIVPYEDTAEDEEKLKEALAYLLVAFPVYRIYSNSYPFSDEDMKIITKAFSLAESKGHSLGQYFERLHEVFNGVADRDEQKNKDRLYFVMRCQQFTGPLAAKGVEDTTFYVYNRLISRNEVGDTAGVFGITTDTFHQKMAKRQHGSLNATSTHDTKRGEDARMRINVLSEIPEEWEKVYQQWKQINQQFLTTHAEKELPDSNDQYFLYQTLVGTYPLHKTPEEDNYTARVRDYMLKVIKEAKRNTSWSQPNEAYEAAMQSFVERILSHQPFLDALVPFVKKVAHLAAPYSLGQTLLKVTVPGIPDVYQGSEYWDLSMVDPDNRRPVDYQERTAMLQSIESDYAQDPVGLIEKLGRNLADPTIKMFTLLRALKTRKSLGTFFAEAAYHPLQVNGTQSASVLAFLRKDDDPRGDVRRGDVRQVMVVVPLKIASLNLKDNLPIGNECWQETSITLDTQSTGTWKNAFTNQTIELDIHTPVAKLCNVFPVALLIKQ